MEIVDFAAGGNVSIQLPKRPKQRDIIPISDEALQLIGYSPEKAGLVFKRIEAVGLRIP